MNSAINTARLAAIIDGPHVYTRKDRKALDLPPTMTLEKLTLLYLKHKELSIASSTMKMWQNVLADLVTTVGERELTIQVAEHWRDLTLSSGLQPSTTDKYLRIASFFLNWMVQTGYAQCNVFHYVKRPKFSFREARANRMTEDEFQRAKLEFKYRHPTLYYLLLLTYHAGMRLSDACLLQREHIDWESHRIVFLPFKNRKSTTRDADYPLECDPVQPTYDVTQMLRELCDQPAVPHWTKLNFVQPDLATDYMASHKRVAVSFKYWLNKIGIQRSTHPGRRAFCSVIANHSGMSPTAAARLTGQSIQTFESYVTPDPDAARLAIRTAFQKAEELCTTKKNQIHLKSELQAPGKSPESSAAVEPKAGQ